MRRQLCALMRAFVLVLVAANAGEADVTIGDFTFSDAAFADRLVAATPNPGDAFRREYLDPSGSGVLHIDLTLPEGFAALESLVVGADLHNWVGVMQSTATLTVGFDAPTPIDGEGDDIVLFDIGNRESIAITIGGVVRTYPFTDTGDDIAAGANTRDVNFAAIDLADFGVGGVDAITLHAVTGGEFDADPTALAALNVGGATGIGGARAPHPALLVEQNSPNPFTTSTEIRFALPRAAHADLAIYDTAGRVVRQLVGARVDAGAHVARWDGADASGRALAAGVYFYRFVADGASETRKLVILR